MRNSTEVKIFKGKIEGQGAHDAAGRSGNVFGAGRGKAGDRYEMAFCSNVRVSEVNINIPTTSDPSTYKKDLSSCITGSVYGGAENGHVMENATLTLTSGLVGHAIYGGGKGKGTYETTLKKIGATSDTDTFTKEIYSLTAGKVYGNTEVEMTGGLVVRNVYGGGNMGSVGVGNYAGGADDYSTNGYGEKINGNLWDGVSAQSQAFLNSGKTIVKVTGGTIGYIDADKPTDAMKDGLPYGNIFGGCRGESAPNVSESPRYQYTPEFFTGYVNETEVTIGTENDETPGPRIYGSIYGGGQDGHVRRDATVTINSGRIGSDYTEAKIGLVGTADLDSPLWLHRGNVYGAGSGIGKYVYDFNYDGKTADDDGTPQTSTYHGQPILEEDYSTSAGSVTRFTKVVVNGGTIYRNVYGGGSLATVGPPKIGQDYDPYKIGDTAEGHGVGKQSTTEVIIKGSVGAPTNYNSVYGGEVYGGSRGDKSLGSGFANTVWTLVKILKTANIKGNVFGGGDSGVVRKDTDVRIGEAAE